MDFVGAVITAQGMANRFGGVFVVWRLAEDEDRDDVWRATRRVAVPADGIVEAVLEQEEWRPE